MRRRGYIGGPKPWRAAAAVVAWSLPGLLSGHTELALALPATFCVAYGLMQFLDDRRTEMILDSLRDLPRTGGPTVIVTGSRKWTDAAMIAKALAEFRPSLVVHGACPTGADKMADDWAKANGVRVQRFPADWRGPEGKGAGPARNGVMLATHPDAIVLGFPLGGPGTADCLRKANRLGMLTLEFKPSK